MLLNIIFNIFLCFLFFLNNFYYKPINKEKKNIVTLSGKTMGTYWQVKIPGLKNQIYIKKLIQKRLNKDEKMISSWDKKSVVSQFNKCKKYQQKKINKSFYDMISTALRINKKTHGKLDITISSLINTWGFGTKRKPINFPTLTKIQKNMKSSGSQHLKIIHNNHGFFLEKDKNGIKINLSTLGEGFAVDHLSHVLQKKGIKNYTISVGGTVFVKLEKNKKTPKIIAIQKPTDQENSIHLLVYLKNKAISTAGSYRNYYYLSHKRISHIIDPKTGMPINHNLVSVSVITSKALEADGWDTGLLILGFKKAQKLALKEKLAVCLITKTKNTLSTWISPRFKKFLIK